MDNGSTIRDSYLIFPSWTQNFFTWLTGKALNNQRPLFVYSIWIHFFTPLSLFILGILGNIYVITDQLSVNWFLIPIFWIFVVAGTRNMVLTIRHECVHNRFSSNKNINKILGELVTILLVVRTAKAYQYDHVSLHHNNEILCSRKDPHIHYLAEWGLKLGMSKKKLWINLAKTLLSPYFYLKSTYDRIKVNVTAKNFTRRFLAIVYLLGLSYVCWVSSVPLYKLIVAFFFPLFVLSTASSLIETISEHPMPPEQNVVLIKNKREALTVKCWSILSGAELPLQTKSLAIKTYRWIIWIIKMIGHLIVRLTILPGPLPSHEMHHRKPGQYDWRVAFYEKQKDIQTGHSEWPPYREIWGLIRSLDLVFHDMSQWESLDETH